jgi:nucleotidyltransferase/DNA polymerase involved in DNA repair
MGFRWQRGRPALQRSAQDQGGDGLNASAGISYNKFPGEARLRLPQTNGQYVIYARDGPGIQIACAAGRQSFHGIGPATSVKMKFPAGSTPAFDKRNQSLEFMQANFRESRKLLHWMLAARVDNSAKVRAEPDPAIRR